jgi:hypothetical protein
MPRKSKIEEPTKPETPKTTEPTLPKEEAKESPKSNFDRAKIEPKAPRAEKTASKRKPLFGHFRLFGGR